MIVFLDENRLDVNASFSATSATVATFSSLYDNDLGTKVVSIGSNDSTPEEWYISFSSAVSFNRIFVGNHNIKAGTIWYSTDDGANYNNFSNIIAWSDNTASHNYFEFSEVTGVTNIYILMTTTQTADAQKYIGQFRAFSEIGEVQENPVEFEHEYTETAAINTTANGGIVKTSFGERFRARLLFQGANTTDMTLFRALKDRILPFYVYPCGGVTTYDQEGFRVQDMHFVNWTGNYKPSLRGNFSLLDIGTDIEMMLEET